MKMRLVLVREKQLPGWLWLLTLLPVALGTTAFFWLRRKPKSTAQKEMRIPSAQRPEASRISIPQTGSSVSNPGVKMGVLGSTSAYSSTNDLPQESFSYENRSEAFRNEAGEWIEPDDLTQIVGITPAFAHLLNEAGIYTYDALANFPAENLGDLIHYANPTNRTHMQTWSFQARLAAEGRWDELDRYQSALRALQLHPKV